MYLVTIRKEKMKEIFDTFLVLVNKILYLKKTWKKEEINYMIRPIAIFYFIFDLSWNKINY